MAVVHQLYQQVLSVPTGPFHLPILSEKMLSIDFLWFYWECKRQRHQEIWLPCILLSLRKPAYTAALLLWFLSETMQKPKTTHLIRHFLFARIQFPLGLVFTVLFLFTEHCGSSIFPSYWVVCFWGVSLKDPDLNNNKKEVLGIQPGEHI